MERQALWMAIFMGLYVPILTGISVAIHRWVTQLPEQDSGMMLIESGLKKSHNSQLFPLLSHNTVVNSQISYQLFPQKLLSKPAKFTHLSPNLDNEIEIVAPTANSISIGEMGGVNFLVIFLLIPPSPHPLISPFPHPFVATLKSTNKGHQK